MNRPNSRPSLRAAALYLTLVVLATLSTGAPAVAQEQARPPYGVAVGWTGVAQVYQIFGLPTTLLLDAEGVILARVSGPLDELALRSLLANVDVRW